MSAFELKTLWSTRMVAHRSHRIFNINIYKKTKKRRIYEIKKNIIKYKIKNILKNLLN